QEATSCRAKRQLEDHWKPPKSKLPCPLKVLMSRSKAWLRVMRPKEILTMTQEM
ncbi:hypothetical protein HK098_000280, partial [Nowakowskiella sp. JEL0407]